MEITKRRGRPPGSKNKPVNTSQEPRTGGGAHIALEYSPPIRHPWVPAYASCFCPFAVELHDAHVLQYERVCFEQEKSEWKLRREHFEVSIDRLLGIGRMWTEQYVDCLPELFDMVQGFIETRHENNARLIYLLSSTGFVARKQAFAIMDRLFTAQQMMDPRDVVGISVFHKQLMCLFFAAGYEVDARIAVARPLEYTVTQQELNSRATLLLRMSREEDYLNDNWHRILELSRIPTR